MSNLKKKTTGILIGFLLLLFGIVPAHADLIGSFTWIDEGFGPVFSVLNISSDSFFDVFVDLDFDGDNNIDSVLTLATTLDPILPSESRQSTDLIVSNITSAALRLTYPLQGFINVSSLTYLGDSAPINYTSATVPEPSVILLLCSGLAGLIFWKKSRH